MTDMTKTEVISGILVSGLLASVSAGLKIIKASYEDDAINSIPRDKLIEILNNLTDLGVMIRGSEFDYHDEEAMETVQTLQEAIFIHIGCLENLCKKHQKEGE